MTKRITPLQPPPPALEDCEVASIEVEPDPVTTGLRNWPGATIRLGRLPPTGLAVSSRRQGPSTGLKLRPVTDEPAPAPERRHDSERPTIPPAMPAENEIEPQPGMVIAGRYRLERLLRNGGMGTVWVGTHLDLDRPIAIKFITRAGLRRVAESGMVDPIEVSRARFEREARAVARVRSMNVVQVYDHGIDRGLSYIVMELLEGEDLGARLQRAGRLSVAEASAMLQPIAHALQRAHDAGVVHRDLKPENVFLAKDGDVEVVKILDFGVSKTTAGDALQTNGAATLFGTIVGTPLYMSPEQATASPDVDHRSDLWSLGVIVYQALTGRRPFSATMALASIIEVATAAVPPPSSFCPDLQPEVDAFFVRALARKPDDRFQSAREMAQAFSAIVKPTRPAADDSGVEDEPEAVRPRKYLGRSAAAVVVLVAAGVAVWSAARQEPMRLESALEAPVVVAAPSSDEPADTVASDDAQPSEPREQTPAASSNGPRQPASPSADRARASSRKPGRDVGY